MVITLTGTPGTGKTTIAEKLEERGYNVIHLSDFLEEHDIGEKVNGEREVRINEMIEKLGGQDFSEETVIEGHLAHHFESDICVVLRCRPDILEKRLSDRNYSDRKVEENIEAEKIDIVLTEAVQNQENVVEIDTTENSADESTDRIIEKVDEGESDYGDVDWTEFL